MTNYLLAGGGTAGHVNPLLALAAEIRSTEPDSQIWALGTAEGLESRLVPAAGLQLLTIPRLPFPRKLSKVALGFPRRYLAMVKQVENYLRQNNIDVVVGFGGYASAPAYTAAKRLKVPYVIHEANALAGMANRWAAGSAAAIGVAFHSSKMKNAWFVGMPLRAEIARLAKTLTPADRVAARAHFGLDSSTPTLLVTGGSLGAKRINDSIEAARGALSAAGIQVLHIVGDRSDMQAETSKDFVRLKYCDRMDLAIAAADFAVARAGAATVSEFSAIGLPAVYVPYPIGNGEQKFNVSDVVEAGGGVLCLDENFTVDFVQHSLIPLVSNTRVRNTMAEMAKACGVSNGSEQLHELVKNVLPGGVLAKNA
jgi:UDP-N-acetylglucosamine--N-acetylmuramyl-(pentapeptide) pyrophosphoryl-undecaprenol N-acetylglucosamine transferase